MTRVFLQRALPRWRSQPRPTQVRAAIGAATTVLPKFKGAAVARGRRPFSAAAVASRLRAWSGNRVSRSSGRSALSASRCAPNVHRLVRNACRPPPAWRSANSYA